MIIHTCRTKQLEANYELVRTDLQLPTYRGGTLCSNCTGKHRPMAFSSSSSEPMVADIHSSCSCTCNEGVTLILVC
jgi:hypothetical protein